MKILRRDFSNGRGAQGSLEDVDFSRDSGLEDSLLTRIREECFHQLADDDLAWVSAAGTPPRIIKREDER